MNIIIAMLILGIIVFIHELGHFTFAKIFKVPVREFSIGMGKRIFSFVKGKTRYSLKLLPFGGSCAMVGEDIAGTGDFTVEGGVLDKEKNEVDFDGVRYSVDEIEQNNFSVISPIKKAVICLSGPLFNIVLGSICSIIIVVMIGITKPIINNVVVNSPAEKAEPYSLQVGDEIMELSTYGSKQKIRLSDEISLFMYLNNDLFEKEDTPLSVKIKRDNKILDTLVYPKINETEKRVMIGIGLGELYRPKNLFEIIKYGIYEVLFYIDSTIKSLRLLIAGKFSANEISGPIGTVAVMGGAIKEATSVKTIILMILSFMSLISVNLAVMNLIPIPALDGGRILEAGIEMIIGHRLNEKVITFVNAISMGLLLILMIWIFGLDIYKILMGVYR